MLRTSLIEGCGFYLPQKVVTNDDLSKILDTSDEWIVKRTGIKCRHIASDTEGSLNMAHKASLDVFQNSSIKPDDIDAIIVATTTPEKVFPSTACLLQNLLGIKNAICFDMQAACSGFIYAVNIADSLIKSGSAKNILVIGVDKMSSLLDWQDRSTAVLFGDGAGAIIVRAKTDSDNNTIYKNSGIIDGACFSDASLSDILYTEKNENNCHIIKMNGKEVFKAAVSNLTQMTLDLLKKNNLTADDISLVIPHQANYRILLPIAENCGIDISKFVITLTDHSNTSAASIPLAFGSITKRNLIKRGDIILMEGVGAGFTWGYSLFRY